MSCLSESGWAVLFYYDYYVYEQTYSSRSVLPLPPFTSVPIPTPDVPSLPSLLTFLLRRRTTVTVANETVVDPFDALFDYVSVVPLLFGWLLSRVQQPNERFSLSVDYQGAHFRAPVYEGRVRRKSRPLEETMSCRDTIEYRA